MSVGTWVTSPELLRPPAAPGAADAGGRSGPVAGCLKPRGQGRRLQSGAISFLFPPRAQLIAVELSEPPHVQDDCLLLTGLRHWQGAPYSGSNVLETLAYYRHNLFEKTWYPCLLELSKDTQRPHP